MIHDLLTTTINGWAVLAAAASTMVIGYLWYGLALARPWGILSGWTEEKIKTLTPASLAVQYGLTFTLALTMSVVTAFLLKLLHAETLFDAWILTLVFGIGYVVTAVGTICLFERQRPALFAINVGYRIVIMFSVSTILQLWN